MRFAVASGARPHPAEAHLVVGLACILLYALPLFVPPQTPAIVAPSANANFIARLFPHVPTWWVVGRLIALLLGAILVAAATSKATIDAPSPHPPAARRWTRPWMQYAALLAAAMHAACLRYLAALPPAAQTLYMIWFLVPAGLLAWGCAPASSDTRSDQGGLRGAWRPVGVIIVIWLVFRLVVSWHSPRAADIVDSWRTFGGLVRLATTKRNFLTESMDPQLPGVNATPLFFQGLPLLEMTSNPPTLAWVQVANAAWLVLSAAMVARLAAILVGSSVAAVATAIFLFSPFSLLAQLSPTVVFIGPLSAAALGLSLVEFGRSGSPATLVLLGGIAGITATYPALAPATALTLLLAAWRCRKHPRIPWVVMLIALLTFVATLGQGVPGPGALRDMAQTYAASHWPMAVAEPAVQGQLSPTTADWLDAEPPPWWAIPTALLLSPFAIARHPLLLWGDVSFEPLSAGLAAVGLLVCARHVTRWRLSQLLLAFLVATLVPGVLSGYDRPALLRVAGAPVPLALLAAVGFRSIQTTLPTATARRWGTGLLLLSIVVSGTLIFDVVNPRILPASSFGLLVRSVGAADLNRVALLTAHGKPREEGVDPRRRHWEFDWLRAHHPYIDEIVRCVPRRPIPLVPVDRIDLLAGYDVVFWSPALEQTAGIRQDLCRTWPDAALYTIVDAAGLSRLYAARPRGPGWSPSLPQAQWTTARCAPGEILSLDLFTVAKRS